MKTRIFNCIKSWNNPRFLFQQKTGIFSFSTFWGKYIFKLFLVKYQYKEILGEMSTKYPDKIIWSESVRRCLGWCNKKSDQLQEEMSDSYFSNSIRRSCWMGMWAGKINSGEANNAGDRWVLFAILLTLAGKKGPRLNRLWFQSLGRRECCGNLFTISHTKSHDICLCPVDLR